MVVVMQSMFSMNMLGLLAIPLATVFALAVLLGLVADAIRVDGTLSMVVALLGCAIVGAAVSTSVQGVRGVIAGACAGAAIVPVLLVLKAVRWPDAPILGDDGGIITLLLVAVYFAAAALGAVSARTVGAGLRRAPRDIGPQKTPTATPNR